MREPGARSGNFPWRNRTFCRGCGAPKPHPPVRCQFCPSVFSHVAGLRNHFRWSHVDRVPSGRPLALLIDHGRAQARGWPLPALPQNLFGERDQ